MGANATVNCIELDQSRHQRFVLPILNLFFWVSGLISGEKAMFHSLNHPDRGKTIF